MDTAHSYIYPLSLHDALPICIFTNDGGSVQQFREEIDAGMLGVNIGAPAPMAFFPFSGWKYSFYGDLHANGKDGVNFYTRQKVRSEEHTSELQSRFDLVCRLL